MSDASSDTVTSSIGVVTTGASLAGVTVTANVSSTNAGVDAESVARTVTIPVPDASAAYDNVRVVPEIEAVTAGLVSATTVYVNPDAVSSSSSK